MCQPHTTCVLGWVFDSSNNHFSETQTQIQTMATLRSRTTDTVSHYRSGTTMHTRRLQEGLYTHLDEQEKAAFIEVLNTYGVRKDILELVNSLRKILNTPVKRQLFPLVRGVIRKTDMEAFDLLTRGGKSYGTLPRPFLYRPHAADISVLRKHRTMTLNKYNEISYKRKASSLVSDLSDRDEFPFPPSRDVFKVCIETRDVNYDGFGFNIRGGSEYGLGVYVSSVDEGGPAEIQGLQVGDLIVEANDISFQNISHREAARVSGYSSVYFTNVPFGVSFCFLPCPSPKTRRQTRQTDTQTDTQTNTRRARESRFSFLAFRGRKC